MPRGQYNYVVPLISQNKTPKVNNIPFLRNTLAAKPQEKFGLFSYFLHGGKSQKTCIQKRWKNNPTPFFRSSGPFYSGCFISRDKVTKNWKKRWLLDWKVDLFLEIFSLLVIIFGPHVQQLRNLTLSARGTYLDRQINVHFLDFFVRL